MNEILRTAVYYVEFAIKKPLYLIVPFAVVLVVGAIFISTLQRNYYSEGILSLETQPVGSTLASPTVANERVQVIVQRLQSRDSLLELVEKFDLFPTLRDSLPPAKLADVVRKNLVINTLIAEATPQYGASATIQVGFNYGDPETANKVATELTDRIIDEHKRARQTRAAEAVEFLGGEVRKLNTRIAEREKEWTEYMTQNNDALPSRVSAALLEVQSKGQELTTLEQSITALAAERSLMEGQLRLGIEQSTISSRAKAQLAAAKQEIAQKSLTFAPTHPDIIALQQKVEELESQVKAEADKATKPMTATDRAALPEELALIGERIANSAIRLDALNDQRQRLVARIGELNASILRAPEVEGQFDAIRTEKDNLSRNLADLTNRYEAARLGERLEQADSASPISMIEAPDVPVYPTNSWRLAIIAVLAAATAAGAAGVYVADMMRNNTVRGAFDLEEVLGGRALVLIPDWDPKKQGFFRNLFSGWRAPRGT